MARFLTIIYNFILKIKITFAVNMPVQNNFQNVFFQLMNKKK